MVFVHETQCASSDKSDTGQCGVPPVFALFGSLLSQVLGMRLRKMIPSRFRNVFFLFFPEKYTPNHGFPEPNLQKPFPSLWGFATYR